MSQIVQTKAGQSQVQLPDRILRGQNAKAILTDREFAWLSPGALTNNLDDLGPGILASAPVSLSGVTETNKVVATFTPGFACQVVGLAALVTTAASTASRSANFQVHIDPDTTAGTNEVQTVTITGTPTDGNFTLTFAGQTTGNIAYNANAGTVQTALEALSNIASGDVAVTGGPGPGTPWVVTFGGAYAKTDVPQMTANGAGLTGGSSPAVAVTTSTPGDAGEHPTRPTSGGVLALTSANVTPAGKIVPASRIIPMDLAGVNPNVVPADGTITVRSTGALTAFAEGAVSFLVLLDALRRY